MAKRKRVACSNGKTYKDISEATRDMGGFSNRSILRVLQGKQPSAYGLRWWYTTEKKGA
jgi:hypothetical protein